MAQQRKGRRIRFRYTLGTHLQGTKTQMRETATVGFDADKILVSDNGVRTNTETLKSSGPHKSNGQASLNEHTRQVRERLVESGCPSFPITHTFVHVM